MTLSLTVRILAPVLVLALAGCSMGAMLGPRDTTLAGATPSEAQAAAAASGTLPAIATECPPIKVREGAGSYRVGAGNSVRYQAVIDRISRNCVVSNRQITMTMGAAGRVVPGPALGQSAVTVPLRFAVQSDDAVVFSQKYDIPVSIDAMGTNEFAQTVDEVAIPYSGGEDITVWVGFDN